MKIKLPFGGSKERGIISQGIQPLPSAAEDPHAGLVAYYAADRTPIEKVVTALDGQFKDPKLVGALVVRTEAARQAKRERDLPNP